MLFYKPKQHSKQCTCLKFVIYIEMTDQKFSLTSQCHKSTILHIMFKKAIWPVRLSHNSQSTQDHVEYAWRLQDLV